MYVQFDRSIIDEVCGGNDIIAIISSYFPLKQKGNDFWGLCPFHKEKSPSFKASAPDQTYHCFGCGAHGNVIGFIMQYENVKFPDALQILANRINFALPEKSYSADYKKIVIEKETLKELHIVCAKFFHENLNSVEGKEASNYLDMREVSENFRKRFGLGYATSEKNGLYNHLKNSGFDDDIIVSSGLVAKGQHGGFYDKFTDRLMFPIFDFFGKVVAFGGRTLINAKAKYLNSPETLIFSKSENLYGINFARKAKVRSAILVEGYMDVLALHQAGFQNAVAALGTAFNDKHAKVLKKIVSEVILLFDSDEAGVNAAKKAISVLVSAGISTKVLTLENAKDPDEFVKKFGKIAFEEAVKNAKSHINYLIDFEKSKLDLTKTDEKVKFTLTSANILKDIESRAEREAYARDLSKMTDISFDSIVWEVNKLVEIGVDDESFKPEYVKKDLSSDKTQGLANAKKFVLNAMLKDKNVAEVIARNIEKVEFDDEMLCEMFDIILDMHAKGEVIAEHKLLNYFDTPEKQKIISQMLKTPVDFVDLFLLEKAVSEAIQVIKKSYIVKQMNIAANENNMDLLQILSEKSRNTPKLNISFSNG